MSPIGTLGAVMKTGGCIASKRVKVKGAKAKGKETEAKAFH